MKAVVSMNGKSFQKEMDLNAVQGKILGDKISGDIIGLEGYELQVTGGNDKQGFPMRRGVAGAVRKRFVLSEGTGYRTERKGVRRRKGIRGEVISEETAQVNMKVLKEGAKKFDEFFKKDEPEEKKPEEVKDSAGEKKAKETKKETKTE
ncbi:MAG: 30S ribosomal protein S6e [Candidatus Aenigmarchaeota archaeon]|nr:30S ribosomal protein S6e [Candidatus Aenigmarchaeota archaeon]